MTKDKDWIDEAFDQEDAQGSPGQPDDGSEPDLKAEANAPAPDADESAEAEGKTQSPPAPVAAPETKPADKPITEGQLAALMAEREKRQAAEAEREKLRTQLQEHEQRNQAAKSKVPDPFDDPEGYRAHNTAQMRDLTVSAKLDVCEDLAREKHGDETVDAMLAWWKEQIAQRPGVLQEALQQRNPYAYSMRLYQQSQLLTEVGDDPKAYREKLKAELLAEIQSQTQAAPAPARPDAPPPSLAKAGGSGADQVVSDDEFFESVFKR